MATIASSVEYISPLLLVNLATNRSVSVDFWIRLEELFGELVNPNYAGLSQPAVLQIADVGLLVMLGSCQQQFV